MSHGDDLQVRVDCSQKEIYDTMGQGPWGDITIALNELLKLTRLVRLSSISHREKEVPENTQNKDDDSFQEACRVLVRRRFPDARSSLTDQLGETMMLRRRRLLYRRHHEAKLTGTITMERAGLEHDRDVPHRSDVRVATESDASPLKRKTTTPSQIPNVLSTLLSRPGPSLVHRLQDNGPASSIQGARPRTDGEVLYPPKPTEERTGTGLVVCPYCFEPLETHLSDKLWEYATPNQLSAEHVGSQADALQISHRCGSSDLCVPI